MILSLLPLRGRTKLEVEGMFRLKSEAGPGMCLVAGCKKRHKDPRKVGTLLLCSRHWQARWRAKNPKQAAWRALKDHAVARRIPFSLTLQTFIRITEAAGYWNQDPATHGDRLSIDRIDVTLGYSDENVQVLTVSENVVKGNRERFLSPEVREILARRRGVPAEAWQMDEGKHWLDDDPEPF